MLSVLDLFRVGIGPSSSHTVGPIRIALRFVEALRDAELLEDVQRVSVELQGSLALTGAGHATPKAVMLGLSGFDPETLDPDLADASVERVARSCELMLAGEVPVRFDPQQDIVFAYDVIPALHPNGMRLQAFDADGAPLADETWYSTGGGFIATQRQLERPVQDDLVPAGADVPFAYGSARELLAHCAAQQMAMHEIILANEVTKLCRGKEAASQSYQTAFDTFSNSKLNENLPILKIDKDSITIVDALKLLNFCKSNGEGRRLIKGKGIKLNNKLVVDENLVILKKEIKNKKTKVSVGKKRHALIFFS